MNTPKLQPIEPVDPAKIHFFGEWLVTETGSCTCGAGDLGHEQNCGIEPLMSKSELAVLLTQRFAEEHAQISASLSREDPWTEVPS
jgi:hypothetical protein